MLTRQLDRFLDAQSDDMVAVWIVLQILIRRLAADREGGRCAGERAALLRAAVAARMKIACTDVWN